MMDLFDAIYSRRSVRKYSKKEVSDENLKKIIDAGRFAPSACDIQGWRFIVVNDSKVKKELVDKGTTSFIKNSPLGILVLYNNQTDNLEYMDYLQSAAACIQNMILAAHSLGIGSCWVCHLPSKKELRSLFSIPEYYDPIAYLALGYPEKEPKVRERKQEVDELIYYNKFYSKEEIPKSVWKLSLKRIMRKIYYRMPFRRHIRKMADERFEKKFDD